eukprot:1374862-Pyramimonas_sp.AAC.1
MPPHRVQGNAHLHSSVLYRFSEAQEFVPFSCNPEGRTQRLHVNGTSFWAARTRYKTEGYMVLLGLFSPMDLPG